MSNLNGQMLGRYQIIEQLGEGGMATVYKGFDTTLQRNVAIKVIKSDRTEDPSFRKRFDREARALAQLSHPHIVHINDFGEQEGVAYLVMDYISGGTLKTKMGRPMPYQEAARLLMPIAQALGFAHSHKIVHRDIKPANILLTDTGIPMLSDFGIAKMLESSSETIDLTSSGMGVGTPAYMAPEQTGNNFDHRADIYSLGIVFYELVTGRRPYDADTPLATLMKHASDPLPSPRNFVPSLPDAVEQVIFKALSKNPNERFQSMEEFAHQFEQLQFGNLETTFARVSQPEPVTRIAPPVSYTHPNDPPAAAPIPAPILNLAQDPSLLSYPQQPVQPSYPQMPVMYAQPQKRSSIAKWVAIIFAIMAVGAIGLVAIIGGAYLFWPDVFTTGADLSITQTANSLSGKMTSIAGEWGTVTAQAKNTSFVAGETTRQAADLAGGATQIAPSSTQKAGAASGDLAPTQTAAAISAAGLLNNPRVAFFDNSNIWVTGLDAKIMVQLTTNGADKKNLRWSPDGKSVYYISGKCVQTIDLASRIESKLVCFNYVNKITGFEISPDGKYAGVLADDNLYVGPYHLDSMNKMTTKSALKDFSTCNYLSGTRFFHLLGDDSKVVVTAFAPGEDAVRIFSQGCVAHNAAKWDEFPAERFRPYKFNNSPTIYDFGWNGARLYSMTTNAVQNSLGYLYFYNNETRSGEQSKPMVSDCCYSSPSFSFDGSYLTFGFIDMANIATDNMRLFALPFSDLGTGKKFDPIPIPASMLKGSGAKPQPVIYLPSQP